MINEILAYLAVFGAVGAGLIGGLLFAFSNFVMRSLVNQPGESGARTMREINSLILNPLFLTFFMGTAVAGAALGGAALFRFGVSAAPFLLAGAVLYLIGVFAVTAGINVPLNNRLEALNPASAEGRAFWPEYVQRWMRWNHARTAASLAASACWSLALRAGEV